MKDDDLTQQYGSWGDKLLQHTDVLYSIQYDQKFKPITVQLALCEICDSDCPFCSVAARPLKSYIPWAKVEKLLADFKKLGAKSIEITGGGNPLLYRDKESKKNINDVIRLAHSFGFDIGIITNTEKLERHLDPAVYDYINWIRISLIKLDEGKNPEDYDFGSYPRSKMGLSYIIYESTGGIPDELSRTNKPYIGTTVETIDKMAKLVEMNPELKFVRIAGNCLDKGKNDKIKSNFTDVVDRVDQLERFFIKGLDYDDYPLDEGCYIGAIRPYIAPHPEGGEYQVYICTSHVLNHRTYDLKYSLGSIDNIEEIWDNMNFSYAVNGYPYEVDDNKGKDWCNKCNFCYYRYNNQVLHTVAQQMPEDDRNFA
jgi:hypothetical protein